MAEETEKKKPKATLIKHRKTEPVKTAAADKPSTSERKKVVVVKKKVVVKRTPKAVPSESPSEAKKQTVTASEKPAAEKKQPEAASASAEKKQPEAPSKAEPKSAEEPKTAKQTEKKQKAVKAPEVSAAEGAAKTELSASAQAKKPSESSAQSSERISSGKDTPASPPRRGPGVDGKVQVLETKRTGGRAGVVAGRRVDGGFNRHGGAQAGRGGQRDTRPGQSATVQAVSAERPRDRILQPAEAKSSTRQRKPTKNIRKNRRRSIITPRKNNPFRRILFPGKLILWRLLPFLNWHGK